MLSVMILKNKKNSIEAKKPLVLILGTSARGGISSVVNAYESSGFYFFTSSRIISTHVEGGFLKRFSIAIYSILIFLYLIFSEKILVVHMHMSMRGSFWRKLIFQFISRIAKIPNIVHLHGSEFATFYENSSGLVRWLIRYLFNNANSIVVLSRYWCEYISKLTCAPVAVIGNFVVDNVDFSKHSRPRVRKQVLFMGQFGKRKGIYDLIRAFSLVLHKVPDARLYCVGNGDVDGVIDLINSLGISHAVVVPGWVSGQDKEDLLASSGLFVLPSYNEGLPMSIIESMSYSLPVISTCVGGIPEMVCDKNGVLIEPGVQHQLVDAILKVFDLSPIAYSDMCKESRNRYVDFYSDKSCLIKMRDLYKSLGVDP